MFEKASLDFELAAITYILSVVDMKHLWYLGKTDGVFTASIAQA